MRIWAIAGVITVVLVGFGCTDPPKKPLSHKYRPLVDSLFVQQKAQLDKEIDSVCFEMGDSVYRQTFDSLFTRRLEEIQKLSK